MRKLMAALGAGAMTAAGLLAVATPAQAAACTLVQSEIYNGANLIAWSRGLDGCSGDVYWEIQSGDGGTWQVTDSGTTHYDDQVVSYYGDVDLPCYLRVYAAFGDQERLTRPVRNNNCAG
ncbi:hypothetical protein AB0J77_10745 [Micromonospora tulbaghiae]|uniref:Secreted protein n=3 Tax=Micromonospora TaxID=1873 RepID=A0AAW4JCA4_9ACTN|nr:MULTISPECIES: hypothetical protein [Micromonospora]AXH92816.1 hypothetical protein DVH21_24400 [Micromonospora aurantiaca]KAB1906574.1 hypothetical protein F8279_14015 [Micromonospora sp. AMSO1212t]MBC9001576.1 hypothetical protein [Micromonospora aurantiaca]MBO4139806.1 hypothetical protein [Micromonospora tulbaghiae]MDX5458766.1 hypothetical protein [Micromonospora tulbaghiae]